MKAKLGVIFRATIFKAYIVAHLKAEAIAIVVASAYIAECETVAMLDEDATSVVAVDCIVVLPVAVQHQILYADIVDPLGGKQGKKGGGEGLFL